MYFQDISVIKPMEKIVIIGGGPAGLSAAVYAARAGLEPLVIAPSFGGQLLEKVWMLKIIRCRRLRCDWARNHYDHATTSKFLQNEDGTRKHY